ncbi:MAG TPA: tetratricopeptide repeat protein [Dehalococcoidia bacterium]|nr:tetratricopeptide repeat protein [Dehalococcoidia bacterium]
MAKSAGVSKQGSAAGGVPFPGKVKLPRARDNLMPRPRLLQQLSDGLEGRLTLLTAPAGFGKTSLLAQFARECERPVCWYAVDGRDQEAHGFVAYLLASLRQQFPWLGGRLEKLLGDRKATPQQLIDLLSEEVYESQESFVLVLDDIQALEPESSAWAALSHLLSRVPENCHLLLASRRKPELAALPLLAARQEVSTLSADDLALTLTETEQFLKETLALAPSAEQLSALVEASDGWAAPLVLLAAKLEPNLAALRQERLKPSDTLYQYFEQEVIATLPSAVQAGLLKAGVPLQLDPAFCRAVLDLPQWEEEVQHPLESANLLHLVPGQDWPRLWRPLRSFLVSKLRLEDPKQFVNLHLRAAVLLEEHASWNTAVYHFVQAQAWERVVRVMDQAGPGLFEEGNWNVLADWLESVPEEQFNRHAKLVLWKARILQYLNQPDQALQLLVRPIRGFEADQDWGSLAQALVIRGTCLRTKGEYQAAKEALSYARSLLLEHNGSVTLLTEARKELGVTYAQAGEFELAMQELQAVLDTYEAQGDLFAIASTNQDLAGCYLFLGQLPEALTRLEKARRRWLKLHNNRALAQTLNNIGFVQSLLGELKNAAEAYELALQVMESTPGARGEAIVLNSLADCKREAGDWAAADELYERSLQMARDAEDNCEIATNLNSQAEAQRLRGDLGAADLLVNQALAEAARGDAAYEQSLCHLTRGLVLRDRGDLADAVSAISQAVEMLRKIGSKRDLVRGYFNLADAYFAQKRKRMALDCLETVAALISELGYDGFIVAEASRSPLLIQYAAANKVADGYYANLVKRLKGQPAPAGKAEKTAAPAASEGRYPALQAYGFGNLRVVCGGREVSDLEWRSEKSKEMFFYFLTSGRPLRKEEIVTTLWPAAPEDKTSSYFHSTLYRLRQALYPECIVKDGGAYSINPQSAPWFDVEEFAAVVKQAEALPKDNHDRLVLLEKALALYQGAFAPDFDSEWADNLRWQLEEQHLRLLGGMAAAYAERGDHRRCIDLCQQILAVDELNQTAWQRLIRSYLKAGETEAAKFAYRRYTELVERDEMADDEGDSEDWDDLLSR